MTTERPSGADRDGASADESSASAGLATAAPLSYDYRAYEGLLEGLQAADYSFVGFDGAIDDGEIALRHDVDLSVERAATMARIESSLGIESTYFLLVTTPLYDLLEPETRRHVRTIVESGHDIGLHFDPHHYWDEEPDAHDLAERVLADRDALERAVGVAPSATSIHVPPEWALGVDFEHFDNAYRPAYFEAVGYLSDSNQKWRRAHPFAEGTPDAMQLLVHPGLWGLRERPMRDIVASERAGAVGRLDEYLDPLGH